MRITKADVFLSNRQIPPRRATHIALWHSFMDIKSTPVVAPLRHASKRTINVCQFLLMDNT